MATKKLFCAIKNGLCYEAINIINELSNDDLVIKDHGGGTIIHYVDGFGHIKKTVTTLVDKLSDKYGKTALDLAITHEIKKLLQPMVKSAFC